ncbi:MAG: antirestriction protein ArdA [Robiginitomaculum sp.]|nr:antirestriction protein ArdA [Robiginitomaculum sp.]
MTNTYHATPYDISASGFYFNTYEDYLEKSATHRNEYGDPVEEYEIQFIDGDNYRLFGALGINQANLKDWFDSFEELDDEDVIKVIYLSEDLGYAMDGILDRLDDVILFEGSVLDYAISYLEDTGLLDQIPENLRYYFDTESFARDLERNGDIASLEVDNTHYVVQAC